MGDPLTDDELDEMEVRGGGGASVPKLAYHYTLDVPRLTQEVRRLRKALAEIAFSDEPVSGGVARDALGWTKEDVRRMYTNAMRGSDD